MSAEVDRRVTGMTLSSDQISTKSPMSVSGFTSRYLRVTHTNSTALTVLLSVPKWTFLAAAWALLIVWNALAWTVFFWFTIVWRAYRNSRRRDKLQAVQHQEMLSAIRENRG